jgi:nucleotide-binding universal stress UspA family protein
MRNARSDPQPPGENDDDLTSHDLTDQQLADDCTAGVDPLSAEPVHAPGLEPIRLPPLLPRRHPWLVVEVDGSPAAHGALVWALREAARREATVLAVTVPCERPRHALGSSSPTPAGEQTSALHRLEAQVLRAIAETGVHGRVRTAVMERPVLEALTDAAAGADLVIVGTVGKTVLRPAVARHPVRRLPRGA